MREEKGVESCTMHWWDEGASLAEIGSFDVYVDLVLVPINIAKSYDCIPVDSETLLNKSHRK